MAWHIPSFTSLNSSVEHLNVALWVRSHVSLSFRCACFWSGLARTAFPLMCFFDHDDDEVLDEFDGFVASEVLDVDIEGVAGRINALFFEKDSGISGEDIDGAWD